MKKILCPTDFSDTAHTAIAYAAKLAKAIGADLTLLNVQSLYDYTPAEITRGKEMSLVAAAERLQAQSREVAKSFRIACYSEVEPTRRALSTVIAEKAKHFDLIVMGSDGPDDLYQFFSGSNTYHAIVKSDIPLLLIPAGYLYSEINHIVYAFDYLHQKDLPLAGILPIVRALNCDLTVLQVLDEEFSKEDENRQSELQDAIRNFYGELKITFETIRSPEIAASIHSYIVRNEPDALALCSTHRTLADRIFHKSIVKNLTAFSDCPVFVFHP